MSIVGKLKNEKITMEENMVMEKMCQQNRTGYPHIDKPWMKYYDSEKAKLKLPSKTLYENVRDNAQPFLDETAITYYSEKIKYGTFLENIENFAKVLTAIGISSGKRVLYLMANLPETAYALYGSNYIGAISDFADPRPDSLNFEISAQKILKIIKEEKIDGIVALNQCYLSMIRPIEPEVKEMGIDNVLLISASDSMTPESQKSYIEEYAEFNGRTEMSKKLKELDYIQEKVYESTNNSCLHIVHYSDLKKNVNTISPKIFGYATNNIAAITHSSGTSGTFPKAIPLTNESIMSYGFQLHRSHLNAAPLDSSLQILPYFSAYGLGIANYGFSYGFNMIQVPEFQTKNLGKLIVKYKPNSVQGTPNWCLSLLADKTLDDKDLSFLKLIGYGGDSMSEKDELKVNRFLKQHNCSVVITKGHGMSETSGGSSYAIGEYNIPGSMGIPTIDSIYAVVDPVTKELVKFQDGEDVIQGEFIISSPGNVRENFDGKTVIKHGVYDGLDFIYTGDIGTMDRNGILRFLSRMDRAFTRYDGFKVKPYEIETIIKKVDCVRDCLITSYLDKAHAGNLIQANIILEENYEHSDKLIASIVDQAFTKNPETSTRQIPSKIVIKKEFPVTMNSKVDYHAFSKIENEDEEYFIHLDETSVSAGNLRIERGA